MMSNLISEFLVSKAIHAVAYNVSLLAASIESNVEKLGHELRDMSHEVDLLTVQVSANVL